MRPARHCGPSVWFAFNTSYQRIVGELLRLGVVVSATTVRKVVVFHFSADGFQACR